MLKHRGGSLQTWNADGTKADVLHYGPGLHQDCKECQQPKHKLCVTKSGKTLNKSHSVRLTV